MPTNIGKKVNSMSHYFENDQNLKHNVEKKMVVIGDHEFTFFTDNGVIELDGEDITLQPEHIRAKKIGRLFQDPLRGTAPDMSILENLYLAAGKGGWLSILSKKEKDDFRFDENSIWN